ncbi:MAG: thrombospondin type 3 repeat-containing protein [Phycisphaerae bacterium]|nr:thrombospondin type 3 repeat-containing protein [Phycisphaerae bacterium]
MKTALHVGVVCLAAMFLVVSCTPAPPVTDSDADGIADGTDNCPSTSNADQADSDADGVGDACDATNNNEPSGPGGTNGPGTSGLPWIKVPDPLSGENPTYPLASVAVPAVGQAVTDATFQTTQTRVVQTEGLRHEYSRFDPFNHDRSMVLLQLIAQGQWLVYRTPSVPYDQAANAVGTLDVAEPRWDPTDVNRIWGLQDLTIVTVDVQSGQSTTVKNFTQDATIAPILSANPDLYRVTTFEEGEASADMRYWALLLQGTNEDYRARYVFTWDRQQDQVLGVRALAASESRIDWVGMSSNGTWVLIGGDWDNGGNLTGLTLADRTLSQFHRMDYGTAHSDVGFDSDGNEVIVMQNVRTDYIDLLPLETSTQPILETGGSYAGTNRTPLVRLYYDAGSAYGLHSGVHISCNHPGWCVVSTYSEPNEPETNWLDRTITLVRLDRANPRVFYLAKVHGTRGAYWEETQATITTDGMRIVWATNWNQNVGQERVWLMEMAMPAGWTTSLDN